MVSKWKSRSFLTDDHLVDILHKKHRRVISKAEDIIHQRQVLVNPTLEDTLESQNNTVTIYESFIEPNDGQISASDLPGACFDRRGMIETIYRNQHSCIGPKTSRISNSISDNTGSHIEMSRFPASQITLKNSQTSLSQFLTGTTVSSGGCTTPRVLLSMNILYRIIRNYKYENFDESRILIPDQFSILGNLVVSQRITEDEIDNSQFLADNKADSKYEPGDFVAIVYKLAQMSMPKCPWSIIKKKTMLLFDSSFLILTGIDDQVHVRVIFDHMKRKVQPYRRKSKKMLPHKRQQRRVKRETKRMKSDRDGTVDPALIDWRGS